MAQATGSKTSAKTGVITLGRRQWAVGLSWQLADARDTAVRKAKEQAARNGNTLYCVHTAPDGTFEYATASEVRDNKAGMNALASALVSARPPGAMSQTWIAIFDLPDERFYLVAARNGAIDPQSDVVFPTLDDAIHRVNDIDPDNDWPLFCDPRHELPGSNPWPLELAVRAGKPTARLRVVDPTAIIKAWAFRGVALGIIGGAGYFAYSWTTAPIVQPKQQKVVVPPPPWANKESGVELARICLRAMPLLPAQGPAWKKTVVACAGGAITATYQRTGDVEKGAPPVVWFTRTIAQAGWPQESIIMNDKDRNKINVAVPMPIAKTIWKEKLQTRPLDAVTSRVRSDLDTMFVNMKIEAPKGTFFKSQAVTLTTASPPDYLFRVFEKIEGLTLTRLVHDGKKYETTFEYHVPEPLPPNKEYERQPPPPIRVLSSRYADFYAQRMGDQK
ncbi:MAG: type 4b pilus protein PilO2 [Hyphomicrobiales bacterium]|nr:type 4b pilus protein PilO2 [Hyphomicrobiales bacterium]MCO5086001.1 type 4b pilus protein PilO2 [Methylobacteriaceae bacterium]